MFLKSFEVNFISFPDFLVASVNALTKVSKYKGLDIALSGVDIKFSDITLVASTGPFIIGKLLYK